MNIRTSITSNVADRDTLAGRSSFWGLVLLGCPALYRVLFSAVSSACQSNDGSSNFRLQPPLYNMKCIMPVRKYGWHPVGVHD
jgi:hypothetical protein